MTEYGPLRETICEFTIKAAERLRKGRQVCGAVNVYIRTGQFSPGDPYYSNTATAKLPAPSADTRIILKAATDLFDSIWKNGYRYAKTGVWLGDLCERDKVQLALFSAPSSSDDRLMTVIDRINRGGYGKIRFGGQRAEENWFMKQAHLSPAYTTRWSDLPTVS
jgi:DNA polymerase V